MGIIKSKVLFITNVIGYSFINVKTLYLLLFINCQRSHFLVYVIKYMNELQHA